MVTIRESGDHVKVIYISVLPRLQVGGSLLSRAFEFFSDSGLQG